MSDRVLLITGASSGIGAATARRASAEGYRLTLAGRRLEPLEALSDELGGPDRSLAVRCDVTSWEEQQAMVASTVSAFGQLDAVLANAGYGAASGFRNESPEHWRGMVLTNVLGPALTIRATVDAITARRGHVLLTGSVASRRPRPGSLYATTKSAVAAMAEALRLELADSGVRVTLVSPGMVDTPFFDSPPPLRGLDADDVARAVMYALAQPAHVDVNEVLIRPTAQT